MINQWDVLARLKQLISVDDDGKNELIPLCNINLKRVYAMLSDDADKDDIRVLQAAAALCCYDYALKLSSDTESITSFKAGDITLSKTGNAILESAEKFKNNAFSELVPLMKDSGFSFCSVEVGEVT